MSYSEARRHADQARAWMKTAEQEEWKSHDEWYALQHAQIHATLAVAEAAIPPAPAKEEQQSEQAEQGH